MATPKLKVGLIGCGGISQVHLEGWKRLNPECQVVALRDIRKEPLDRRGEQYGVPASQRYSSHREMLRQADVDAVDICVPNMAHAPITIDALQAGKHVICEKPLAPTPAAIRRMIAARDRAKKLLMTAQHMRFARNTQNLKAYLDTGAMGKVYYARSQLLRRRLIPAWGGKGATFIDKKVSGGGPTIDIGVHILDLTLHLMGQPEPVSVSGMAPCMLGKREDIRGWWGSWDRGRMTVEDFAAGFVRFADGSGLTLECSWLLNVKEQEFMRVSLMGTEAGCEWPALTVYGEKAGCLTDTQLSFPDDKVPAHHVELEAFQDAILHKRSSPVPAEQSLKVARILDGFYRSQATGREVRV